MSFRTVLAVLLGAALMAAVVGCDDGDAPATAEASVETGAAGTTARAAEAAPMTSGAAAAQASAAGAGIWVVGESSINVEPDLVVLSVGVEVTAPTVAEARAQAASAMDAVVAAVKAHGLEDRDVQTESFNVWPQYEYPEVMVGNTLTTRRTLVGYTIDNSASVRIRDVDAAGDIIDSVAEAAGDSTRIDGVRFSIEDPKPFMAQLREEAVRDAVAQAEHLASLTGVSVGDLVSIGEVAGGAAQPFGAMESGLMMARAAPATSISGGELELSLRVQAVFAIE